MVSVYGFWFCLWFMVSVYGFWFCPVQALSFSCSQIVSILFRLFGLKTKDQNQKPWTETINHGQNQKPWTETVNHGQNQKP
jgi:hypothetical protein